MSRSCQAAPLFQLAFLAHTWGVHLGVHYCISSISLCANIATEQGPRFVRCACGVCTVLTLSVSCILILKSDTYVQRCCPSSLLSPRGAPEILISSVLPCSDPCFFLYSPSSLESPSMAYSLPRAIPVNERLARNQLQLLVPAYAICHYYLR